MKCFIIKLYRWGMGKNLLFSTNSFVFSTNKLEKNLPIFNQLLYNENTKINLFWRKINGKQ